MCNASVAGKSISMTMVTDLDLLDSVANRGAREWSVRCSGPAHNANSHHHRAADGHSLHFMDAPINNTCSHRVTVASHCLSYDHRSGCQS